MPYSTCNYTTEIDENECIGDSLTTINANFSALDVAVCDLVNTPQIIINDSPTINLSLTTGKVLSADVRPDSIRYSNLASWQPLSASPTLSAEAVQQRLAKAWALFDVSNNSLTVTILNSFNIESIVYDTEVGAFGTFYTITFKSPMPDTNYVGIAGDNMIYSAHMFPPASESLTLGPKLKTTTQCQIGLQRGGSTLNANANGNAKQVNFVIF